MTPLSWLLLTLLLGVITVFILVLFVRADALGSLLFGLTRESREREEPSRPWGLIVLAATTLGLAVKTVLEFLG